jgi:hypothetical protein
MYTRLQIALWSAAAIIGVGYGDSEAANTKTPTKTSTVVAKSTSPVVAQAKSTGEHHFTQVLSELHQAKHLLDHANHTYNGHRAKADHEIGKAIHILHHEHHKKGTTPAAKSTAKAPHKSESAQASDTQLRQAEKLVHAALHELKKHPHNEKAHHAAKLLHEAAHEIELAIHAHHKHHQNQAGALKKA